MKKKLVYTPAATAKLAKLRKYLDFQFGSKVRKDKMNKLYSRIHLLPDNENMGISVREIYGIDCDYRCIYAEKNYVFYLVTKTEIQIIKIYDEREDFMQKMFGIHTTSPETDEYWGE